MPINGKTDFVGPARCKFMGDMGANQKAVRLNDAIVEANMKGLYGDRFKLPEGDDTNVGGDVVFPTPVIIQQPRSNAAAWVLGTLLATLLVVAILAGGVWLYLHPATPPVQPPPPATSEDFNAQLFDP